MYTRNMTSVELKRFNIQKLMKQVKSGKKTLKEAEINRRLDVLEAASDVGKMWAEDLRKKYIQLVKDMNK